MKSKNYNTISWCLALALFILPLFTQAQEKKVAPTSTALYNTIAHLDSVMFAAFNSQDMATFKPMFTEDLEWFQDNGGLLPYKIVFENFDASFKRDYKLTRTLVKGTLEVHPIKDYGAIQIGTHQFHHIENGKPEIGTFKFLMIWKETSEGWKISRVVSYDH